MYYAHSTDKMDKSDWQPLAEHLRNVADLARDFAAVFDAAPWGHAGGWGHDAGKAKMRFIRRLEGNPAKEDHVTFGGRLVHKHAGRLGLLLSYAIVGHHSGLPDGGMQERQLHFRLEQGATTEDAERLPEWPALGELQLPFLLEQNTTMFSLAFFTRMIFSCLVDADFLDTECFCSPEKAAWRTLGQQANFPALHAALRACIADKEAAATPGKVNTLRKNIVRQCRAMASLPQGFFSLTVPTGGGKTLSSLTFALDHAGRHGLRRVIYAIPFTSIIEQNAQVFQEALGEANVLEHHCNYRERDQDEHAAYNKWRGLATENWDAPVVVTTNVQFFESLFSNMTSRCRKLHNIAASVIVLDEAQAIPTEYLEPCLAALKELVAHYRCTVVLCTATQPALDDASLLRSALPSIREIIDEPEQLYAELKRVRVDFVGKLSNVELAGRLDDHQQAMTIVSTKKQAQEVFSGMAEQEGAFHLSTNLYPAHRLRVLKTIRQRLLDGLPCRVVATSLVEAGVDVDFPVIYRAMAGLDSLAQAAGRCNREGRSDFGQVYVYEPETLPNMPWLQRRISRTRETLRSLSGEDCLGLVAMRRYFELLYDVESLDAKDIVKRLNPKPHREFILPFREVARDFRMIEEDGTGVIMPGMPQDREIIHALVKQLREDRFQHMARRKLQHYAVTVRSSVLNQLLRTGAVEMIHDLYPVLHNTAAYDAHIGFRADMTELWEPEILVQ